MGIIVLITGIIIPSHGIVTTTFPGGIVIHHGLFKTTDKVAEGDAIAQG